MSLRDTTRETEVSDSEPRQPREPADQTLDVLREYFALIERLRMTDYIFLTGVNRERAKCELLWLRGRHYLELVSPTGRIRNIFYVRGEAL